MVSLSGRAPWYAFAAGMLVLIVLIGLSIATYLSVATVHGATTMEAVPTFGFRGLALNGTLPDDGALVLWFNITIDNPSPHDLAFDTIIVKAWMKDYVREAGVGVSWPDTKVEVNNTIEYYYWAFAVVNTSSRAVVPGTTSRTLALTLPLTHATNPSAFAVVQNITNFAASQGIAAGDLSWRYYALVGLDIEGVPGPTAPSAAPYLINLARVVLQEGEDLGT